MQKAISKYWPVFVLPTLIAFIIGFIWPFIWGIFLSFQRYTTVSKTTFVGIQNYINVFQDSTNPLIAIANDYVAAGKTSVDWCFSTMPSEEWKNEIGRASCRERV